MIRTVPYFSSEEVARETGTRIRTLQRWVERGFVSPDRDPKKNRDLRWNPKHLREARVLAGLRSMGVSNQQLHKAIARLVAAGHNPTSTGRFLVRLRRDRLGNPRGGVASLVKVCDEGDALDLMRGGRVTCLWDLDPCQEAFNDDDDGRTGRRRAGARRRQQAGSDGTAAGGTRRDLHLRRRDHAVNTRCTRRGPRADR